MKTHESTVLGRYLVSLANDKRMPLNMTKLQKLLFIIYGYYLTKQRRIVNEHPQAWPFGPVFPRVHKNVDYTKVTLLDDPDFNEINNDPELKNQLEEIIVRYAPYSATQLSNWSHMEGSPWDKTTNLTGFKWGKEIPDVFICEYFLEKRVIE